MNMIEMVARAIQKAESEYYHISANPPHELLAKAAIKAMREPTKGMKSEGCQYWEAWPSSSVD